jgi:hypothetical protein
MSSLLAECNGVLLDNQSTVSLFWQPRGIEGQSKSQKGTSFRNAREPMLRLRGRVQAYGEV